MVYLKDYTSVIEPLCKSVLQDLVWQTRYMQNELVISIDDYND